MPAFDEANALNKIAAQEASILGIKNSFGFAANPDNLTSAMAPAVAHYYPRFDAEPWAYHNVWKTNLVLRSILFVAPRESSGGKLKFLENAAMPFGYLWRQKFQTETVISGLLTDIQATKVWLSSGEYTVGGIELTYGATEWIGWVFEFTVQNAGQ